MLRQVLIKGIPSPIAHVYLKPLAGVGQVHEEDGGVRKLLREAGVVIAPLLQKQGRLANRISFQIFRKEAG